MLKIAKEINYKKYFPFLLFFICILTFHLFTMNKSLEYGDHVWYFKMTQSVELFEFITDRYKTWTSRIIIESIIYIMVTLPKWCFLIFSIINFSLVFLVIQNLFNIESLKSNVFFVIIFLMFDFYSMNTAGWIATIINYLFPLLFLFICLFPVKNYLYKKELSKWWVIVIYCLCFIIACNQEQVSAILFIIYFLLIIYIIINKYIIDKKIDNNDKLNKTNNLSIYIYFSVIILSLIFSLTSPGNLSRLNIETINWLPQFKNWNLIQKFFNGCNIIIYFLFVHNRSNITINLLLVLLILSSIYIFINYKNIFIKISSVIPSVIFLLFSGLIIKTNIVSKLLSLFEEIQIINNITDFNFKVILSFFVFIIFMLMIFYNIILILLKNYKEKYSYILIIILIVGFTSVFIMGFSPTCFISDTRTLIFMQFAFIISSLIIFNKIPQNYKRTTSMIVITFSCYALILFIYQLFF